MPEKLVDLLSGHAPFEQRRRHGVAQQVRMDALGDTRQRRRFLHELLDTARGIGGVAPGGKQRPYRAIPQIRPEFVREFREEGDIALLAASLNFSHFVARQIRRGAARRNCQCLRRRRMLQLHRTARMCNSICHISTP
jgi:hypothetical protein